MQKIQKKPGNFGQSQNSNWEDTFSNNLFGYSLDIVLRAQKILEHKTLCIFDFLGKIKKKQFGGFISFLVGFYTDFCHE